MSFSNLSYIGLPPIISRPATSQSNAYSLLYKGLQPHFSSSFLLSHPVTCVNYVFFRPLLLRPEASHIQASIPGIQPMHTTMQSLVLMRPASLMYFPQRFVLRPEAHHIQAYSLSNHSLQPLISQPASSGLNVTFVKYVFFPTSRILVCTTVPY